MTVTPEKIMAAFNAKTIEGLLEIFPERWAGIAARIIESGAELSPTMCKWAPRWSKIPPTTKKGVSELEAATKSVIYRVHDSIHQLWGLPTPSPSFTVDDRYIYKRAQICGEVAVLTLTEFVFCQYLYESCPELKETIEKRNAIPMRHTVFKNLTTAQIAARMDGILHKQIKPRWLRDCAWSTAFAADYVPMLEYDRQGCDKNWQAMKEAGWVPTTAPNCRYSDQLDGLELTLWMIADFEHLMDTDSRIDVALRDFNRERRSHIVLPEAW